MLQHGNVLTPNIKHMLEEFEKQARKAVDETCAGQYSGLGDIFKYQMGWTGQSGKSGKRIRPMMLLLTVAGYNEKWDRAIPAAIALELIHNYSLIHDDIEDNSQMRRGVETVWVKWGQPQGINSGDSMLNLAFSVLWKLENNYSPQTVIETTKTLQRYSMDLTKGQYLDIDFESRSNVTIKNYIDMVEGKTCSLFKAALEIGGILGESSAQDRMKLQKIGSLLGQAYQIQDDWLGIWGDVSVTGKSNQSDLLERKKTYPVILGLQKNHQFLKLWDQAGNNDQLPILEMAKTLEAEGIKQATESEFNRVYEEAFSLLKLLGKKYKEFEGLSDFIRLLLKRQF
jgi:geranylgeranyl diphosphate synthase type I